ncbi:MAG: hypothetical protein LUE14_08460 [Clostridiales bacterium]|nr:hypothetical protein [Clostridiales bacterium]
MASINGISLRKFKKFRGEDGRPLYRGELWARGENGSVKIADWSQTGKNMDDLDVEPGFSKKNIINAIRRYNGDFFEANMLTLGSYMEYERFYRAARKEGNAGVAVMQSSSYYICQNLDADMAGKSNEEIEQWMEPDKREMEKMGKGADMVCLVFRKASDFVLGDRIQAEMLAESCTWS